VTRFTAFYLGEGKKEPIYKYLLSSEKYWDLTKKRRIE